MKTSKGMPRVADDICPTCGKKMKKSQARLSMLIHGENLLIAGIPHLRCPACDERLIALEQAKALRQKAHDIYRKRYGLLTADEIRSLREGLGLTQSQLAQLLQLGANTISRWEANRLVQSASMDVLLRLIRDVPQNVPYLRSRAA